MDNCNGYVLSVTRFLNRFVLSVPETVSVNRLQELLPWNLAASLPAHLTSA